MSYVKVFFNLADNLENKIRELTPEFGYDGFGEVVYYRTYSRRKPRNLEEALLPETDVNGNLHWSGQEQWADTIMRVVNGTFSIRKNHYLNNNIEWVEDKWQMYAYKFAKSMFKMNWLPPGRGLWAMGTNFVYERGSMALNNCGFTNLGNNKTLAEDYQWMMDALMMGVGVGFHAFPELDYVAMPTSTFYYDVPDTREGWALSTKMKIEAYTIPGAKMPILRYHLIREKNKPIKGFGGLASGPDPLIKLHNQIDNCFKRALNDSNYKIVQLKTDIANMIGCCVVAGNVRRSAELALGGIDDEVFLNLKDYDRYPERAEFGWMSNNTAGVEHDSDFQKLGEIARRVPVRGEPGIANWRNFKYGRTQDKHNGLVKLDKARGLNPCGEIQLEDKELCNVVETAPTRCSNKTAWLRACEYATFYSSTVSLLPTHWSNTNAVVARNRRIGVGIVDYTGWSKRDGLFKVTQCLKEGFDVVCKTNQHLNGEAGVPEAIRKTTIKPGGTVPKLMGRTSGAGYPTFEYLIRRMRVSAANPMVPVLINAKVPYESDVFDSNTLVFSFPITSNGAKAAEDASIWEQAANLVHLQRWWADNSVSNTIYFKPKWVLWKSTSTLQEMLDTFNIKRTWSEWRNRLLRSAEWQEREECRKLIFDAMRPDISKKTFHTSLFKLDVGQYEVKLFKFNPNHEEDEIEPVLANIIPNIKCCSLLPHSSTGAYKQMPEEGITREQYLQLKSNIIPFDWTIFAGSDGEDEKYCQSGICEIPVKI